MRKIIDIPRDGPLAERVPPIPFEAEQDGMQMILLPPGTIE